ncbi:vacuole membrane protein KMS1-like isoform X2 [Olea europaea var. sylvestris]|uniref:vacuole membrane protein KMS1-like isoform X2 n=1 Tax=Olea europaea var. sylvestris TaxID=158386 RepID=UPI000C1D1011|nr:vacuole membrane protein KMS1-like isoform X2 [Olea europaea var. sylvestris]
MSISGLRVKHEKELENLTLITQPVRTLKFFILAVVKYLRRSVAYLLSHGGWIMLFSTIIAIAGVLLVTIDGPHEKHVEEVLRYIQFGLWWVALGVASSIGLGSGLHTFVLYLGPHIALFTIKAMQCGRIDIKSAPYDTIQLKRGPSWLGKDCADFGPPLFLPSRGTQVPLGSILPQVQLEAILWGLGTALGELPPYFISRAASISGDRVGAMENLNVSTSEENGIISARLNEIKRWFLSHAQYLNFFTILALASTVFIICVCNNQLLNWIENELIWVFSFVPGFNSILPNLIAKLHSMKDKYMAMKPNVSSKIEAKKWDFSVAFIWNTIVWFMLIGFFVKIVNATAQRYLKKQQEEEIADLKNKSSKISGDSDRSPR